MILLLELLLVAVSAVIVYVAVFGPLVLAVELGLVAELVLAVSLESINEYFRVYNEYKCKINKYVSTIIDTYL
jgi:hypothetical protein